MIKLIKNKKSNEMVKGCGYQGDSCGFDYNDSCLNSDSCYIDKAGCGWTDSCNVDSACGYDSCRETDNKITYGYNGCFKVDNCHGDDFTYDPCYDFV